MGRRQQQAHEGTDTFDISRRTLRHPDPGVGSGFSPMVTQLLSMQRLAGNRAVSGYLHGASTDGRGLSDDEADLRPSLQRVDAGVPAAVVTPIAVRNGPGHVPINTADAAGMAIDITLTSSSAVDADMATILDSEQVSSSVNHTGSYAAVPSRRSNNSGYMPGHPIPADRHSEAKSAIIDTADNHGGNGSFERLQLDTWKPTAAGAAAAIPNSGYFIRRTISTNGTGIRYRTEKGPRACTVNGFTTTAGPSGLQSEEVEVRPPAVAPAPGAAASPSLWRRFLNFVGL